MDRAGELAPQPSRVPLQSHEGGRHELPGPDLDPDLQGLAAGFGAHPADPCLPQQRVFARTQREAQGTLRLGGELASLCVSRPSCGLRMAVRPRSVLLRFVRR